jgi:hypothetical protein
MVVSLGAMGNIFADAQAERVLNDGRIRGVPV